MEIKAVNVNKMLPEIFWRMRNEADSMDSRNGPVYYMNEPTILSYEQPMERVLFSPVRDANPIFHLMESIWILAGRRDVEFPDRFNKSLKQYSDDKVVYNAAYGHRMRDHFAMDQLTAVIHHLEADPNSRQAVIQLWDPNDLNKRTLDKACNMIVVFNITMGELNMSVMNRSNDVWYGACGANVVHFSFLQEFVAGALDVKVGTYRQISNNLHLYRDLYPNVDIESLLTNPYILEEDDYYSEMRPYDMMAGVDWQVFLREAANFCDDPLQAPEWSTPFLNEVAHPMAMVQRCRREGTKDGSSWARRIVAPDWQKATLEWIERREEAKNAK